MMGRPQRSFYKPDGGTADHDLIQQVEGTYEQRRSINRGAIEIAENIFKARMYL